MRAVLLLALPLLTLPLLTGATVADLRGARRVVIAAAPADDPALARQRAAFAAWREGAAARDVTLVAIAGARVTGSDDAAAALRRRYRLPAGRFAAVLLGKDGHVALRTATPIDGAALAAAIDAMPMRRAGLR